MEQGLMHADYQDLLVVGPVEDTDAAALGQVFDASPEIIMVELLGRRLLERHHLAVLRVEPVLQCGERLHPGLQALLGPELVLRLQPCGILGVDVLETKGVALSDAIGLCELACSLDNLIELHGVSLLGGGVMRWAPWASWRARL